MQIFSDVRKLGKLAEGANDPAADSGREGFAKRHKFVPRGGIVIPVESSGELPNAFDDREHIFTFQHSDRFAQQPPQ